MKSALIKAVLLAGLAMGVTSEAQASPTVVTETPASASGRAAAPAFERAMGTTSRDRIGYTKRGTRMVKAGFWSSFRKVVVCVAAIGAFITGNALWISKLRKAGGVWRNAKKIVKAKGKRAKMKVLAGIFGNVLGIDTVASKCR